MTRWHFLPDQRRLFHSHYFAVYDIRRWSIEDQTRQLPSCPFKLTVDMRQWETRNRLLPCFYIARLFMYRTFSYRMNRLPICLEIYFVNWCNAFCKIIHVTLEPHSSLLQWSLLMVWLLFGSSTSAAIVITRIVPVSWSQCGVYNYRPHNSRGYFYWHRPTVELDYWRVKHWLPLPSLMELSSLEWTEQRYLRPGRGHQHCYVIRIVSWCRLPRCPGHNKTLYSVRGFVCPFFVIHLETLSVTGKFSLPTLPLCTFFGVYEVINYSYTYPFCALSVTVGIWTHFQPTACVGLVGLGWGSGNGCWVGLVGMWVDVREYSRYVLKFAMVQNQ